MGGQQHTSHDTLGDTSCYKRPQHNKVIKLLRNILGTLIVDKDRRSMYAFMILDKLQVQRKQKMSKS